jgi:hypothetical protein
MDENEVKHDDAQGADVNEEEATPAAEGADAEAAPATEEGADAEAAPATEEGAAIGDGEAGE